MSLTARRPRQRTWFVVAATAIVIAVAAWLINGEAGNRLELLVGSWQNTIAAHLGPAALAGWRLYAVAFVGGLAASLSPCILGMLPVNLAFIGATGAPSRRRAALVAGAFVAGVGVVNVVLGLAASIFFAVIVEYRSAVNIGVGAMTLLMGLWMAGILRVPIPQFANAMPAGAGPFVAGLTFALVASPCASPVLVTVLGAATQDGSSARALIAMACYTIGYTALLFGASLSAGILLTSRHMLRYAETVNRVAATALVVFGGVTLAYGLALR